MLGLMQDWPLLCHRIIEHAARIHGKQEVVTRSVEGPIHRTTYAEIHKRALKVSQMLESEHIRNLPSDVKKSSVLVALDAAGVDIKEVIQDAVRRDRALDTYERVQLRAVDELEGRKAKENADLQAQIDKYVTEQRAKIQSNNDEVSREKERFTGWKLKKQQEEKKIAEAVGYFVTENPITTGDVSASAPTPKTVQRS